jgi:hypothetical protein
MRQGVARSPSVVAISSACAVSTDIAWLNVLPPVDVGQMLRLTDAAYNLLNLH